MIENKLSIPNMSIKKLNITMTNQIPPLRPIKFVKGTIKSFPLASKKLNSTEPPRISAVPNKLSKSACCPEKKPYIPMRGKITAKTKASIEHALANQNSAFLVFETGIKPTSSTT